jgi:ribosome-binding ATPase YchF (GTP1/OBG family)
MALDTQRLDRIEEKIDKLSDAVVAIARTEEKLAGLQQDHAKNYDRMNKFSEKLDNIEECVNEQRQTITVINKLFWIFVISIAGAMAAMYIN